MEARTPSHVVLLIRDQLVDSPTDGTVFIPPHGFGDHHTRHDLFRYLSEEKALAPAVVYPYHDSVLDATRLGIAGVDLQGGMTLNPSQPLGNPKASIEEFMGGRGDAVERIAGVTITMFRPIPGGPEWPDLPKGWAIDIIDEREESGLADPRFSAKIDHARLPELTIFISHPGCKPGLPPEPRAQCTTSNFIAPLKGEPPFSFRHSWT